MERMRRYRQRLGEEQKRKMMEQDRQRLRRKRASMSEEERAVYRQQERERQRIRRAKMDETQRQRLRQTVREKRRTMTQEQLQNMREAERRRQEQCRLRKLTRTLPAVPDELIIPKPAPGENVYPIYSQGVICGYIYSGGNQKKPKIFLTEENQTISAEEKPTKTKNDDLKKKSCVEKTDVTSTATQSVNPKLKKEKIVSSSEKISVLPNVSRIEPKVLIANPSDKLDVSCSPAKQPNGDTVDLGRKGSALEDGVSLPVFEMPSKLVTSPAKKNVLQIKNPPEIGNLVAKQNSNPKLSVVMSTSLCSSSSSSVTNLAGKMTISSNAAPGAKNTVILPRPITTNCNQPVILASSNSALQSTNWLTTPVQPNWPNTVTYFLMPTGSLGQGQVYLTSSANTLSTVLPTATTPSLTRTTVSTVDSSVVQLSSSTTTTTTTATPPVTMTASQVTTSNNNSSQLLTTLPLKAIVPKSTYVQLPLHVSTSSLFNKKTNNVLGKRQPIASQLKILKLTNVENKNRASESNLSQICPVTNGEKVSKESVSFVSDTQSHEVKGPAAELPKDVQEKPNDSKLSANSNQTNTSEASCAASPFISKENKSLYYQFSLKKNKSDPVVPIEKRPRGRPKKTKAPEKKVQKKIPIPILPATRNTLDIVPLIKSSKELSNLTALPSHILLVPSGEKISTDSTLYSDTQSNGADGTATELTKEVQEIMIHSDMNANSNQADKLETSSAISKGKYLKCQSLLKNSKSVGIPMKKRPKGQQRKGLLIPRCDKSIASATGNNLEIEPSSNLRGFNLLPCGNYVLGSQKEGNKNSLSGGGNQLEELKANLSEYETNKQLICDKENNRSEKESMESKPSSSEEKEIHHLSSKDRINIKTEPLDYDSGVDQEGCGNWSDNCTSSASSNAATIQPKQLCKKEKESEDESTAIDEENQLVISSCFSLSSRTESNRKLIPIDSVNSDFDNFFFLPSKTDSSDKSLDNMKVVPGRNSKKVSKKIRLKECTVRLEPLNFPSNSLISSSEEDNLPCTKPAENDNASPKDELNIKRSDSLLKESTLPSTKTERSLEALAKSILEQGCLEKLKEKYKSVDTTLDSSVNVSSILATGIKRSLKAPDKSTGDQEHLKKLKENDESGDKKSDSSVNVSSIAAIGMKRLLEAPAKSIRDQEYLKKLKENDESVDMKLDSSVNVSNLPSTATKKSREVSAKSILDVKHLKKLKENIKSVDTLYSSVSVSALSSFGTEKSLEVPAKSILDPEHLKDLKEKYISVNNKTEIPVLPSDMSEVSMKPKSKSCSVSKDVLFIPNRVNNPLKTSNKSLDALQSNDDSLVDLTEDNEADTFIEGCIAFHEQQLYLLQLQMDQHRTALEKLKKEQIYRRGSK